MDWQGKRKALTFSYDDGVEQDERLVALLNRYGMKATFNLNSGIQTRANCFQQGALTVHRMNQDGLRALYAGHEVASHALTHPWLEKLDRATVHNEIACDMRNLSALFGQPIAGGAYPYGTYSPEVVDVLRDCGIQYFRTVQTTHLFELPEEPLTLHPTCHHTDEALFALAEQFLCLSPDRPQLFYVWGHSYEFDVRHDWDRMEQFLRLMAGHDDILYATNAQALL